MCETFILMGVQVCVSVKQYQNVLLHFSEPPAPDGC